MSDEKVERIRLLNKAQLDEVTDIRWLDDYHSEICNSITKIETDLEFKDGTDEWYDRAKSALIAHRIAERNVKSRVNKLTRTKHQQITGKSKAEKLALSVEKMSKEVELRREQNAKKIIDANRVSRQLIERVEYGQVFMHVAKHQLHKDQFELLHALTQQRISANVAKALEVEQIID